MEPVPCEAKYPSLAGSLEVPLEADALADILAEPGLKSDAIHPNADGYRRLADAVHRLLINAGALQSTPNAER